MGVTDLERVRVERLVPGIVAELQARGVAVAAASDLVDAARWRRAARHAARQMGWRIRTGMSGQQTWASSEDYEPGWTADREAARLAAAAIFEREDRRER